MGSNIIHGWTDERVDLLKTLWQAGLSASQIAKRLGWITRNAVIGKVYRLGLTGRAAPYRPGQPKPRRDPQAAKTRAAPPRAPDKPLPPMKGPAMATAPRPWITRTFGECAYPAAGEGADTLSCCAPCGESVYCRPHHDLTHAKPPTDAQRAAAARAREAKRHMKPNDRAKAA